MRLLKVARVVAVTIGMAIAAVVLPPSANAYMVNGNYDLLTNRYDRASWVWFITPCFPNKQEGCLYISARPRLKFYAYYEGEAHLGPDNRWSFTTDVPDGLRCLGYNLPTRETYTWDDASLAGDIVSNYDVGCFNGPPGQQYWTFALQRL